MVKVLFSGGVPSSEWETFFQRVKEVQFSAHGPFDILFMVGKAFESVEQYKTLQERLHALTPLTIYVLGCPLDIQMIEEPTSNVKFLGPDKVGLINVDKNMTICYAIDLNDNSYQQDLDLVRKFTSTLGYRGCDALLTSTWPRESHQFLEGSDLEEYRQSAIGIGAGARWASEAAILTRPRYHFVADVGNFYQRVPYKNSSSNGQPVIYTRLISLHGVIPSKEKHQKWLHALSVQPIIYMKQSDLEEAPAAFTTCPYAPIGGGATVSARMDGPPTKKPRTDFAAVTQESTTQGNSGSFFFGGSSARPSNGHAQSSSSSSKTLFIGGLSREMRDRDLMDAIPDATNVRRPSGKGFAFVDFASHDAAKRVYDHANRNGLTVRGRQLTVGWATNTDKKGEGTQSDEALFSTLMRERVLVPPTEDSKTLYVGNLPHCDLEQQHEIKEELVKLFPKVANVLFPSNKTFAFLDFESYADAMEALSSTLTHQISLKGRPIVVGWSRHGGAKAASHAHPPDPDCKVLFVGNLDGKVTDEDIRKLWSSVTVESIRRPAGRDYAFVEFSSPADAQQAMETICSEDVILNDQQLKFGWAKGKPAAQSDESKECWFCLASPMLKVSRIDVYR